VPLIGSRTKLVETFTMLPPFAAKYGRTACVVVMTLQVLTRNCLSNISREMLPTGASSKTPAM
jgi:hypothetical protein